MPLNKHTNPCFQQASAKLQQLVDKNKAWDIYKFILHFDCEYRLYYAYTFTEQSFKDMCNGENEE